MIRYSNGVAGAEQNGLSQAEERFNALESQLASVTDRVSDLETMFEKANFESGIAFVEGGEMSPKEVKDMVLKMDVEELKEFAKLYSIDIGQSTSQSGISKKILEHLERAAAE